MAKSTELTFVRLVDWIEGRLSQEEAAAVAEAVARADEETQATVAWLRAFAHARETVTLATPPQEVRDLLIRRFQAYARQRQQPHFLRRLVAALTFDSGTQVAMAGIRTAGTPATRRQLVFTSAAADIALDLEPRRPGDRLDLSGQVLPTEEEPTRFTVQLLCGTSEVGITVTDELGEFAFEDIPPGEYQIVVSSDRLEVLVGPVHLHA